MKSSAHRFSPATTPLKFTPAGAERFAATVFDLAERAIAADAELWDRIRDPGTIGKPCPSKEELDRIGLERATAIAALPELMAALETAEAALTGCRPNNQHLPGIRAALAKARPA